MKTKLLKFIATGFGFGYLKPFAGTWGTIPGSIICYFLFPLGLLWQIGFITVVFFISVWSASLAENHFGHDAKKIVIDEILGVSVTMFMAPAVSDWRYYLLGFVLFRIFDVAKIEPAKSAERLPRGWGVTMDDFVAGIYALITLQLITTYLIKL